MKFKNIRDFIKEIDKGRIIQTSMVCIGTMLVAISALEVKEKEVTDTTNQVVEWNEPWNSYHFHDHIRIRSYEPRFYDRYGYDLYLPMDFVSDNDIVMSVIRGEYGNGEERKQRLEEKGYDYEKIQTMVNDWHNRQEEYQYLYPIVDYSYMLSDDGELVKSGYTITDIDEFGNTQIYYYNNQGELLAVSEDKEMYR